MKRFVVDCREVKSFPDFIAAMNEGLIGPAGGEWNGNFNAFKDYLCWPDDEYQLEIIGSAQCANALGHAAEASWLRDCLATCPPSNTEHLRRSLGAAERGEGQTLYELILEIIAGQDHVHLILN